MKLELMKDLSSMHATLVNAHQDIYYQMRAMTTKVTSEEEKKTYENSTP